MSADDLLADQLPGLDVAHLLVEHGALVAQLRKQRHQPTAEQQIRASALLAAAAWLTAETWQHTEREQIITVAQRLEQWITTGVDQ